MAIPEITATEAKRRLDSANPPRLIDVREADKWALGHLAGAELMPLSEWPAVAGEKLTDPGQALLIYCHHGGRSERAAEFLARSGFTDVTNLAGGIDGWAVEVDPSIPRY